MPNDWGDEAVNEWGDAPAAAVRPAKPVPPASSNRWVQKAGEGLVPGFNRLTALGAAATDPMFGIGNGESFGQRYDRNLRGEQAQSAQTAQEHPYVASLVQGAGGIPTALLTGGAGQGVTAATRLGRIADAAKMNAGFGAMYAAGDAPAGADVGTMAAHTIGGGLTGGAIGGALQGGAEALPALVPMLRRAATTQGRKVLTGNTAPMATKKPLSEEAIRAAYDVGAIKPLGTVEGAAAKLGDAREVAGDRYAQVIAALEAKGVTGPNASKLAGELLADAQAAAGNTLTSVDPRPGALTDVANELLGLQQGMHGLKRVAPKPATGAAPGGDLGLAQAESMKRTLQRAAQAEYVKEGPQSLSGEAKVEIASRLRQAVEDAVSQQSHLAPEEAAAFEPIKRELGAIIEASNAANKGAARAANRQTHGLGAKIIAGGALAHGGVGSAIPALLGATELRNRGPATLGWGANGLANLLNRGPAATAPLAPIIGSLEADPLARAIADAMRSRVGVQQMAPAFADQDPRTGGGR